MLHCRGILIIAKFRGVIKTEFLRKTSLKLMDNYFLWAIKIIELQKVTISWWGGGRGLGYKKGRLAGIS